MEKYQEWGFLSPKIRRIMKLTLLFTLLCILHISANTYAQTTQVSVDVQNGTFYDVVKQIEKQSEYLFFYNSKDIPNDLPVSLQETKSNITVILDHLVKEYNLSYKINDRHIFLTRNTAVQQQGKRITGTVKDPNGEPIIGANVMEKGTTNGVVTDIDGKFYLTVSENATIQISYIGYVGQNIIVGNRSDLSVILREDFQNLDEIVVVGYGIQKKVNLTGSVGSVSAQELIERPQPNVQNMIQGKITGLQITTPTGQPGRDQGEILVRGKGSFGASAAPLILIDGLVGELNTLASDDIESISVLKDAASASIYGARAANGVILVTTKKGKSGKPQVSYSFNYGIQQATRLSDQIWDSATYMEMFNQVADRQGGRVKYKQELIDKYKDPNRNKDLYPDYNWMEETFKNGHNMTHNLGINGGTEKINYNISLSYLNQAGLLDNHNYDRYTGLMSLEAQVHERIKIGGKAQFHYSKVDEPMFTNADLVLFIGQGRPMTKPYLPDGSGRYSYSPFPESYGGEWLNRNPVWAMNETSRNEEKWLGNAQLYFDVDLLKKDNLKLTWNTKGGFRFSSGFINTRYPEYSDGYYYLKESDYMEGGRNEHIWGSSFGWVKGVTNTDSRTCYTMLSTMLNLNWEINADHSLNVLLGFQDEGESLRNLYGARQYYPSDSMTELDGGSIVGQSLSGGISEYAIRSLFGRVGYAYKEKYLVEANFRYDATSRISKDNRWGFFPSVSAAWRISEESFIKDDLSWIDNLKLRASWGKLGNSEIGNYPYQDVYTSSPYIFDGDIQQGVVQKGLKDKSLKWETTTSQDVGIDVSILNNLFSLTFDWYNKVTDGILSKAAIPASVGMEAPTINYGKLRNRGVEFEVGHRKTIGDFNYGISFMASLNKNKVLKLRAPSYGDYIYEEGKPYGEHYLYIWDGIFQSEEDIANSPKHPNNPQPGDIKFKDLNSDGVIDGKDRQMVKGVYPKMLYSFNLDFGYKNFDLSLFFQGIAGRKIWTNFVGQDPFSQGAPPTKKYLNAWTPENRNTNVPALYANGYAPMTGLRSTYQLNDASYLRLKNLQLGYNVPKNITRKVGIDFLRIYFSGENLFTFTPYPDYDPERGGDGCHAQYPQAKTYSLGLNLKF